MQCLSPIYIDNPDLINVENTYETTTNLGDTSLLKTQFESGKIAVPCGRCEACIHSAAQEWRVRINEEFKVSKNALFFTLTYQDDKIPIVPSWTFDGEQVFICSVRKRDVQLFLKRLREEFRKIDKNCKLRYYIVSEYGPRTKRPHYHGVIFNIPCYDPLRDVSLKKTIDIIYKCWDNGFVSADKVNPERIGYVTKYLSCTADLPHEYRMSHTKPFRMMSQGLGRSYLENPDVYLWHKDGLKTYTMDGRFKNVLPRYYKRKLFTDEELLEIRQRAIEHNTEKDIAAHEENLEVYSKIGEFKTNEKIQKFKRNFRNKYVKKRKDF